MNIKYSKTFKKHFKQRIESSIKLRTKFKERADLFKKSPTNPMLKDHPLKGQKETLRAFSITGDIRVIYQSISEDEVIFIDIGSHNQVY